MASLLAQRRLLIPSGQRWQSADININPKTARLSLRIARPTIALSQGWRESKITVAIVVSVDGEIYRLDGGAIGGRRAHFAGGEQDSYRLAYGLPWGFFAHNSDLNMPKRLCEGRTEVRAWFEIESVDDDVDTRFEAFTEIGDAPQQQRHNSVAFTAQSEGNEVGGDGVLSVTHTATGTNRAIFAACGNDSQNSTSMTYNGVGMTELWDILGNAGATGQFSHQAAYRSNAQPPTGAQTVTNTLAAAPSEHLLNVVSLDGVDQTTWVGTPVTSVTNTTTPSVTVTTPAPGADDMVIDHLYYTDNSAFSSTPTQGADQTIRGDHTEAQYHRSMISTQPGSAGGVMSWSITGTNLGGAPEYGNSIGAVLFLAAGAAAGNYPYQSRVVGVAVSRVGNY